MLVLARFETHLCWAPSLEGCAGLVRMSLANTGWLSIRIKAQSIRVTDPTSLRIPRQRARMGPAEEI
jgi:hypothetical protein